ncbi:MAG: phosphoribosylamine--glycine ligase [Gammaproteobacteria bacterium]|nr:phosphoribosylamine--glycine ligase [Gammaproteobacteria bacterium]
MSNLKILIIGGGGREHALAWKAAQSALVARVFVAPGNAGTSAEPRVENIDIGADDIDALARFAAESRVDLSIVGPEAALVAGVADRFARAGLACFGPSRAAAQLEGSKTFAKDFMRRHAIPTAAWGSFTDADAATKALDDFACPVVVKADGLAAGKGVVIAQTRAAAAAAAAEMLSGHRHGDAGRRVVVEEFLAGEEVSFICMSDGASILPLASSQDHKAAHDGDAGPNTGGMGACSPAPLVDAAMHARIMDTVMRPAVAGMAADGAPYTGFLYAGLMVDAAGAARVLEFNCRLGDPETQPILLRLRSDLVAHCLAATRGELAGETARWDDNCALGVVLAAAGYPGPPDTGGVIRGLEVSASGNGSAVAEGWDGAAGAESQDGAAGAENRDGLAGAENQDGLGGVESRDDLDSAPPMHKIFHAGTAINADGKVTVAGGRVLCATAAAPTMRAAQSAAYRLAADIDWPGCWYRRDIGHRAIERTEGGRQSPRN